MKKMYMFDMADSYICRHLAATHNTVQIPWMAAIRTLSVDHPVYALLDRLTYQLFSIQPLAQSFLWDSGAALDTLFPITGSGARDFATELYFNGTVSQIVGMTWSIVLCVIVGQCQS
jgi:arachidonate 15-lipoxygenase (second type)/8-lipoxygenase (S-type)